MYTPSQLNCITSRSDVKPILSDISSFLKEYSAYEFFIDSLWENIQGQKKTLAAFDWQSSDFQENSPEWLRWTYETTGILSSKAGFIEEIINVLRLWLQASKETESRLKHLSVKTGKKLGEAYKAHFAIYDYVLVDSPEHSLDAIHQATFIDTLQHERTHVFCRHWKVLKYDIPFATALGILAAQIKMELFNYEYFFWSELLYSYKTNRNRLVDGAIEHRQQRFMRSISNLLRTYRNQIETLKSYEDGAELAVAAAIYFNDCSKARVFLELLSYGVAIEEAHALAQEGIGKSNIDGRYTVFDVHTHKLKMAGWWNPMMEGEMGICAREAVFRGSFNVVRDVFDQAGLGNSTLSHIIGLRGADIDEAGHFSGRNEDFRGFVFFSIPHATYSSTPLASELSVSLLKKAKNANSYLIYFDRFADHMKKLGYGPERIAEEMRNLTLNDPTLRQLFPRIYPDQEGQLFKQELYMTTKQWSMNPKECPQL